MGTEPVMRWCSLLGMFAEAVGYTALSGVADAARTLRMYLNNDQTPSLISRKNRLSGSIDFDWEYWGPSSWSYLCELPRLAWHQSTAIVIASSWRQYCRMFSKFFAAYWFWPSRRFHCPPGSHRFAFENSMAVCCSSNPWNMQSYNSQWLQAIWPSMY